MKSIKSVLIVVLFVLVAGILSLFVYNLTMEEVISDKYNKVYTSNRAIKNVLEARIAEKNYLKYNDQIHYQAALNNINETKKILESISFENPDNQRLLQSVLKNIDEYESLLKKTHAFESQSDQLAVILREKGRKAEDVLSLLRQHLKKARDESLVNGQDNIQLLSELATLSNRLIKIFQDIRIDEKNFQLYRDNKHIDEIRTKLGQLHKALDGIQQRSGVDPQLATILNNAHVALKDYEQTLDQFIELKTKSRALQAKMRQEAQNAVKRTVALRNDQRAEAQKLAAQSATNTYLVQGGLAIISIILMVMLYRTIRTATDRLKSSAQGINEGDGDLSVRLNIDRPEEFREAGKEIDKFIASVQEVVRDAAEVSAEASSVSSELAAVSMEIGHRVEDESSLVKDINSKIADADQRSEYMLLNPWETCPRSIATI